MDSTFIRLFNVCIPPISKNITPIAIPKDESKTRKTILAQAPLPSLSSSRGAVSSNHCNVKLKGQKKNMSLEFLKGSCHARAVS
jgi:hypothetical protein